MDRKIVLAPDVIINPMNFAINLICYSDENKLLIPLSWLWEYLENFANEFGLISLADKLLWYSDNFVCLDEELLSKYSLKQPDKIFYLDAMCSSIAMMRSAYEAGIIEGYITEYEKQYFDSSGWVGYLLNIIPKYNIISFDKKNITKIDEIAINEISKKYKLKKEKLEEIIIRNIDWSTRKIEEFPIYEDYRKLNIEIGQIFSADNNKYIISTSKKEVNHFIKKKLRNDFNEPYISNKNMLMYTELIKEDPTQFKVRDIIKIIDNKELLEKFGNIFNHLEKISQIRDRKEFRHTLMLYMLSWIPGLDIPIKFYQGGEIIGEGISQANKSKNKSILHFDLNIWRRKKHLKKM